MTLKVLWLWGHLFLVRGGEAFGAFGPSGAFGAFGAFGPSGASGTFGAFAVCASFWEIIGNHFLRVILVNYSFCRSSLFAKSFLCGLRFSACALVPYLPCALSCAPCLSCFAYLACIVYVPCTTSLPHALFFTPYPSLHFGIIDNQ